MAWKYYLLILAFVIVVGIELWFSARISRWWLFTLIPTLAILFIKTRRQS
ncbi:hypothetical protein MK904_01640 [Loigolactobacillus coryniformis]|nr:hypothetical protein [Loigolactobacillus coryniformis]MDC4184801.1 hypothetical protein [Loigolactobacillus coryniformis]